MATLEERVAALEARSADSISTSYVTINPDGTISANFSGLIVATGGINLTQPQEPFGTLPTQAQQIRWLRASDSSYRTRMRSWDAAIVPAGAIVRNTFEVDALSPDGANDVFLALLADSNSTGAPSAAQVGAGGLTLTLLDSLLQSDFLQLTTTGKHKIAFGSGTIQLNAANRGTAIVNHGLGATPQSVVITGADPGQIFTDTWQVSNVGGLTFTAEVTTSGNVTFLTHFNWIAIS